ncbi:hypothetical protein THAOC_34771 [Thalassiosira oceanica]|uniref:Disintegrin domain-containing protein n=1 Tax=Thalassiosira oceanica TaxID=159749 RepID=K0R2X5_THAOC|nr:hypothetical protein THAOC_34771 [Thalassiosira oceanica]|eukprot:EJK46555.1 hypothetical protein THAOC_34771 [Thalassiosira oceanica]
MRILKLALTRVIVLTLWAPPLTKSMVGANQSPPTSTTAADFDGVETATGSDGIIDSIDSPRIQQNRRRGKAKAKAKASKIGYAGDGKSSKSHKSFEKCAAQFIGTRTYGGSCEKSFTATIGCENEESLEGCFYQEESFGGSVSLDVCYPFDMAEALSIDGNTCMLGFANGGILLKNSADALDPSCEPKYVLKMTTEISKEPSDELLLYFSSDGGESFYNEDDPRVATRASEDEIHSRRAEVCITSSSCMNDGEQCKGPWGDCCSEEKLCNPGCLFCKPRDCCSDCCSKPFGSFGDRYCNCIPSGIRCGYENGELPNQTYDHILCCFNLSSFLMFLLHNNSEASLTSFGGQDEGCTAKLLADQARSQLAEESTISAAPVKQSTGAP